MVFSDPGGFVMYGKQSVASGFFPEIHVVDLHHHVLRPWCMKRRELPFAPRVLSFDFHTDTLSALSRGVTPPQNGAYSSMQCVEDALQTLHHDEHFDWALRSGTVSQVFICSIAPQNGAYGHEGMQVYSPDLSRGVNGIFQDPDSCREMLDHMLSDEALLPVLSGFQEEGTPFILDLDCDFFLTEKMVDSVKSPFFSCLVRSALMITLSREDDWVRLLRLPGEVLTADSIVHTLREQFTRICAEK